MTLCYNYVLNFRKEAVNTLSRVNEFHNNKPYYLPLLLLISVVTHVPFVLKGFGEIDATKIAVSIIDILNNGPDAAFSNYYFTGVIPLYILYLKSAMKLLNYDYSYLPSVMNYTNAVFGTLIIVPAFFLIRRLFGHATVAFCTVLALIFAPSFYQSTIMGFPHLIAFFFLLVSLCFYLQGLDHDRKSSAYLLMFSACVFLTIAFLFKSDIVLAAGTYLGFLFVRGVRDKTRIGSAIIIILVSGLLFLLLRELMIGDISGTTTSREGLSKWYEYSLIIPGRLDYFIRQTKPIAYGAGIATFFFGAVSFVYYLFKRRFDVLAFIISWAALPVLFWLVMIGNNARHNMITTLPLLAMIVLFFHEKAPRFTPALTAALILANFALTAPSYSILTPSGNLFKSNSLIKERMKVFHSRAQEIAGIKDNNIAVLGTFHNPHVVFEIMISYPSYEAVKLGREDYKMTVGDREFVFIYFVARNAEEIKESAKDILGKYTLEDHLFVSSAHDLSPLNEMGLKTRPLRIIKRAGL